MLPQLRFLCAGDPAHHRKYFKYLTYLVRRGKLVETGWEADMSAVHYDSYTDARAHLKDLLDAAEKGVVATVRRDSATTAVVDVVRLRHVLASVVPSHAQVVPEAGGWSVFLPGLPVSADGASFDEAVDEMVDALREYAQDWQERLLNAPNHRDNWGLVQLISFSDDAQLRDWLVGAAQ
ncbi:MULTISPECIES: prevent-host-death protein [Amycolatopsis]|uniref:Prevent-host-death protein n=1 Tax=Amycolatopsis albidoflavus TaxID=102226 RepID=A0ABW5HPY3_9PSEU